MANVTVSSTIDTLLQSADAAEAKTAISAATAGSVSALSSNALVLSEKEWPIKTVTWSSNQTLTYTGGSNAAGDGVVIQANVTTLMVLTITFTTATVYRNGAVSALSTTVTVPTGKHRFVFWTPDDGTTVYMEDTVNEIGNPPTGSQYQTLILRAMGSDILAQSISNENITTNAAMTNGKMILEAIWLPVDSVVTGVRWYQKTQGNYTGDSYNGVGLYSYNAGTLTLVASSTNDANIWKATGDAYAYKAFSSTYSAVSGLYFIAALWHNGANTTSPALGCGAAFAYYQVVDGPTVGQRIHATLASQTSLPATTTTGALGGGANATWLALY